MHGYRKNEKGLQPVQAPSYGSSVKGDNLAGKHVPGKHRAAPEHYRAVGSSSAPGPPKFRSFRVGKFVMNTNASPRTLALVQQMIEALRHVIAANPPVIAPGSDKDPPTRSVSNSDKC